MIQAIFGTKAQQSQVFLTDGTRIPVTLLNVAAMPVVQVKTKEKEGYTAVQVGIGSGKKKQMSKGLAGHIAKAKLSTLPREVVEIRLISEEGLPEVGGLITLQDVLKPGDIVDVTGTSKGKGFAGGVKRHNFRGGPKTHGQSDRHRAPGSIGQGTTPGRVYKGKRMAGRMGTDIKTLQNLLVVAITGETLYLRGLVPGSLHSVVMVKKTGESKKFVSPQFVVKQAEEAAAKEAAVVAEAPAPVEETPAQEEKQPEEVKKEENGKE